MFFSMFIYTWAKWHTSYMKGFYRVFLTLKFVLTEWPIGHIASLEQCLPEIKNRHQTNNLQKIDFIKSHAAKFDFDLKLKFRVLKSLKIILKSSRKFCTEKS